MPINNNGPGQISGFSFVQIAQGAKKEYEPNQNTATGHAVPLPPVFETIEEAKSHEDAYVEPPTDPSKIGVEMHYKGFSKVFVVYRPWEKCPRCNKAIEDAAADGVSLVPMDNGDYVCPHTHLVEYHKLLEKTLAGDALITLKDNFMTPDGIRRVHVEWLTADPEKQREIERKMKLKKENQVYPPDPEYAFSRPKNDA